MSSVELVNKEDWIKEKGTHQVLKTEEEHKRILAKIAQNNFIPQIVFVNEKIIVIDKDDILVLYRYRPYLFSSIG